ncbi:PRA1 family protein [Melia azedarach]|uniref:PRA1 family protein n=2 Tax=Melia azedarach TaxID=155640 RepID=A0ACC1YUW4_MELAZ|nr:PRA1 family protein [Melia azedarach]KAJ4726818.1 PRA1 family protein [Melia azedarach]
MSSKSPPNYGSLPSTSSPTSVPATTAFLSRARATTQSVFSTRRPWNQLLNIHTFSRPYSFGEATLRLKRNLSYFRVNYAMIILVILFLSLLWHPVSMIAFLIVFVAWFFLYFFRDQPLVIFHRSVDDRLVLGILGVVTIVALVLTHVWLNVLVSLLIGVFLVGLHAAFIGTEALYYAEGEADDNGLFSVVGSPTRAGYSRV